MTLKLLLVVLVSSGCASSTSAPESTVVGARAPEPMGWPYKLDHTSTKLTYRAAVIELMEVSGMAEAMASMRDLSLKAALAQNPDLARFEAVMRAFFDKYLTLDALKDDFVELYRKRFDELQIRQITAFYRTPTGRLSVRALPALIEEGGQVGRRAVEAHRDELMDMMKKEMARQGFP